MRNQFAIARPLLLSVLVAWFCVLPVAANTLAPAEFRIENRNSHKVLTVLGKSLANYAYVVQYEDNGTADHLWRLIDAGAGKVKVQNVASGKVLAVENGSTANSARIQQYDDNGTPDHLWQLIDVGDGFLRLRNVNSGKVLSVNGMSTANNAQVTQYDDNGSADHAWVLVPDGQFKIQNANSNKLLSVAGMSTADSALVTQYSDNGSDDHVWSFVPNDDGTFRVINAHSNKFLAVSGQSTDNGAPVVQFPDTGTPDHNWRLRVNPATPSTFRIQNANSLDVLGVQSNPMQDSAPVDQYSDNGRVENTWLLSPTQSSSVPAAPPITGELPPALPRIASVTALGRASQNPLVTCRDGTYSVLVNGRSQWTFNDTCLSKVDGNPDGPSTNSPPNFISNTLSSSTHLSAASGLGLESDTVDAGGIPVMFLHPTAAEVVRIVANPSSRFAIWPGHVVPDPTRGRELVFFGAGFSSGIGIGRGGSGIAVANPLFTQITRPDQNLDSAALDRSYMWTGSEQAYTSGYLVVGDFLYSYGGRGIANAQTEVHVARVPLAQALVKSQWQYWNGAAWTGDATASAGVYNGGPAGDTLFFDDALGLYVVVYQPFQSADIFYRVARHPEGPWSAAAILSTTETGVSVSYAARVHTEYEENNGATQYLTYVKNTAVNGYGIPTQELQVLRFTFKTN